MFVILIKGKDPNIFKIMTTIVDGLLRIKRSQNISREKASN